MNSDSSPCDIAAQFPKDALFRLLQVVEIIFSGVTLALAANVALRRRYWQLPLHGNLKLIFANIWLLYVLFNASIACMNISTQVKYWTTQQPCDLQTSRAASIVTRGMHLTYFVSFPLWHLAVSVERTWATLRPKSYERTNCAYAVACTAIIWPLSVSVVSYGVWMGMQDPAWPQVTPYFTITTKTNSAYLINLHYALLAIDFCTFAADYVLFAVNKRNSSSISPAYSLSRNYQIKENLSATLLLILPLDACNAILFLVFTALATVVRYLRWSVTALQFHQMYEGIYPIILLQGPLSLLVFMRFSKQARRTTVIVEQTAATDVYFQQFQQQIGTGQNV